MHSVFVFGQERSAGGVSSLLGECVEGGPYRSFPAFDGASHKPEPASACNQYSARADRLVLVSSGELSTIV